ncbi:dATP/dGTP diphosphohydrolase domain-containing protein [Pseudovibrio axinellae]
MRLLFAYLWGPLAQVCAVLTFGAQKYSANSCQSVERERNWDALYRHLSAFHSGVCKDKESGLHHLAHAACNILFLLWFETKDQTLTRFDTPPVGRRNKPQ